MARILVTGVGGLAGSSLARQLRERGHYVLGVDMQAVRPDVASDTVVVPPASSPDYLPTLCELAVRRRVDLVVPTVSDELPGVSESRPVFGSGIEVLIAPRLAIHIANDKYLTMTALRSAGISIPDFGLPLDFASARDALDCLGGAIVVKPRVSRGGRGVRLIEHAHDAGNWDNLDSSLIVQRFAPGTEYAPVVLRNGPDGDPDDVVVVLEKTELKEGRVGNAVSVKRVEPPAAVDVAALAVAAVGVLGLMGPADVDIRRMPDGTPVILEVNARFGANSAQAPELVEGVLRKLGPASPPVR
ncbi:ATP-grasp domain-containing protein [Arthrobacter sp. NA-172]|uniref:ATP-grasp domain-containing protein n=1 Tax=Arthrobacter sp. NA-172 TaxID=3367524 RepID=UPI0037551AF7